MDRDASLEALKLALGRPIAFHCVFAKIGGSVATGIFLSQAWYWTQRTPDGWFWKTGEQWEEETGLTRREQEQARRMLKDRGLIEEVRKGAPAKLYFKVNAGALEEALRAVVEQRRIPLDESEGSVDRILSLHAATLANLSRHGLRRAQELRAAAEPVDYAEVFRQSGGRCHVCSERILLGPGQTADSLQFDHVNPLKHGGAHTFDNVRPAHAGCNLSKGARVQDVEVRQAESAEVQQTGGRTLTGKPAEVRQTLIRDSEITPETTAQTTVDVKARASLLPEWLDAKLWASWISHLTQKGKAVTVEQAKGQIRKLEEFRARGMPPEKIIQQAIDGGWQGFYPLKEQGNGNGSGRGRQTTGRRSYNDRANAALESIYGGGDVGRT
jgi:hypothetical protein